MVELSDGSLIQTGDTAGGDSTDNYTSGGDESAIYKTDTTDAALDPNFGSAGVYSMVDDSGDGLYAESAVLTSQGQLLIGGFADINGDSDSIMLARYDLSTGTGAITGTVDEASQPVADVPVYVDLPDSAQFQQGDPITESDTFGNYSITGLEPGTYTVRVDLSNLPGIASQVVSYTATVGAGQTVAAQNFILGPTQPSTTTLTSPAATLVVGQTDTLDAAVAPASGNGPVPIGTVTLSQSGTNDGTISLTGGARVRDCYGTIGRNDHLHRGVRRRFQLQPEHVRHADPNVPACVGSARQSGQGGRAGIGNQRAKVFCTFPGDAHQRRRATGRRLLGSALSGHRLDWAERVSRPAGDPEKTAAVKTGKALGLAFRVKSIPAAVAAGTEYLVVRVTDPLGDADLITVPDPIAVATPVVALSAAVAAVHPMSVFFGKSGSAVVSVTNSGNVPGTGVLDITFTVPAGDGTPAVTLAMLAPRVSIKPGRTGKYTIRFKVPATLTAGLYDPVVNVSLNGVSATAVDPATFSAG